MANAELQNLARNYAQGGLTLEDYRLQRSQILNSFSMDLTGDQDTSTTQKMKILAAISDSAKPHLSRNGWITAVILFLVLVGGIGLFINKQVISKPEDDVSAIQISTEPLQVNKSITSTTLKSDTPNNKAAVKRLAQQLIQIGKWQQKHINAFQQEWSALTAEEKFRASDTAWFAQLKYDLFHRIAEHRAKASSGDVIATQQAEYLARFAQSLGIEIVN